MPNRVTKIGQRDIAILIFGGILSVFGEKKEGAEKPSHEVLSNLDSFFLQSEGAELDEGFRADIARRSDANIRIGTAEADVCRHVPPGFRNEKFISVDERADLREAGARNIAISAAAVRKETKEAHIVRALGGFVKFEIVFSWIAERVGIETVGFARRTERFDFWQVSELLNKWG